jgi:hypothetical protein
MDWIARDLQRLAVEHKITRGPTAEEWERIWQAAKAWEADNGGSQGCEIETIVLEQAPAMLEKFERESLKEEKAEIDGYFAEQRDKWETENNLGAHAPELKFILKYLTERETGDSPATEKQVNYLRLLGVHDDQILGALGKQQASRLIGKVKELRGDLR